MRSNTFAVSLRFTAANPPLSSDNQRRLSCEFRRSLLIDDRPMPDDASFWFAKLETPIASSPGAASPRGSIE